MVNFYSTNCETGGHRTFHAARDFCGGNGGRSVAHCDYPILTRTVAAEASAAAVA